MDTTTLAPPDAAAAAEITEQQRLQIIEIFLTEVMSPKNNNQNQLADASTEDLSIELFSRLLKKRAAGRAVASSDEAASAQQLKDAIAAAMKEEDSAAGIDNNKKKPRKHRKGGGFISTIIIMVAFGSIATLIFSLSLIHQSGGSKKGEATPALRPSASRFLREKKHHLSSDNDDAASPEVIVSPLPEPINISPPPIFSPAAAITRRMKFDKLRSATCSDTHSNKNRD